MGVANTDMMTEDEDENELDSYESENTDQDSIDEDYTYEEV